MVKVGVSHQRVAGGSLQAQILGGRGYRQPTSVGSRKLELLLPFHVLSKHWQYFLSFRHKARV